MCACVERKTEAMEGLKQAGQPSFNSFTRDGTVASLRVRGSVYVNDIAPFGSMERESL